MSIFEKVVETTALVFLSLTINLCVVVCHGYLYGGRYA